jgi:hypothetical protein
MAAQLLGENTGFSDSHFDALLQSAEGEPDYQGRLAKYRKANERMLESTPVIPIAQYRSVMATQTILARSASKAHRAVTFETIHGSRDNEQVVIGRISHVKTKCLRLAERLRPTAWGPSSFSLKQHWQVGWSPDHDRVECTLATSRSVQKFSHAGRVWRRSSRMVRTAMSRSHSLA